MRVQVGQCEVRAVERQFVAGRDKGWSSKDKGSPRPQPHVCHTCTHEGHFSCL